MLNVAGGDPVRHQVALVDDEDNLLVRFFFADVLQDTLAKRPERIAGVDNMEDNVRGVDDLVQLTIDTSRCALGEYWFDQVRIGWIVCARRRWDRF